ncbi:MAG: hypothetical protein LBS71_02430, partial [Puniceicoccales bacterium]|nr:hypothetical protein [Puniceicoccales bacterium]
NTLAELVRKKIQQLGFRTDDYKVKEFIYSFLRELKQGQGLGVDPIVEIYYAIMKEKPSLLIKRQIQTEINRE